LRALITHVVAERAGVSIVTLYRYFSEMHRQLIAPPQAGIEELWKSKR